MPLDLLYYTLYLMYIIPVLIYTDCDSKKLGSNLVLKSFHSIYLQLEAVGN